jgi:2-dehydro-3-deoxyphosphogluconate aldolase/(4S)-4-hydroxy-2-oxoglutarate aldolase
MDQTFVADLISRNPVIPLLRLERLADALPLVEVLQEGGMQAVEVWLPHRGAPAVLEALREHCTDITVGAGGVRNADEVKFARSLGAHYISSPGLSPTIIHACAKMRLPCLPGVASTSEMLLARELGLHTLIVYPAGIPGMRTLVQNWQTLAPECRFVAQGNLGQAEAALWLELNNVGGVYAEWLADDEDLQRRQWRIIMERARRATLMPGIRKLGETVMPGRPSSEAA